MASDIQICNMALSAIKVNTIASLSESSNSAVACNLAFEPCRDALLRMHPWNFATCIDALAVVAGASVLGWDYVYQLPAACLYPRKVVDESTTEEDSPKPFRELQYSGVKVIVANIEDAYLEYTAKVTDTTLFDAIFVKALSYSIAYDIAPTLTGDENLTIRMLKMFQDTVAEAMRLNASTGPSYVIEKSSYIDSR